MGYGIDTEKFPLKIWGKVLTFYVDNKDNADRSNFDTGLDAWKQALGTRLLFSEVKTKGIAEVEVKIYLTTKESGSCAWTTTDNKNGRDEMRGGTLHLKDNSSIGTVIHEIGHMLGLCHEQDRQDDEQAIKIRKPILFANEVYERGRDKYKNYGDFDAESMMLYGSGYEKKNAPNPGDIQTVIQINFHH